MLNVLQINQKNYTLSTFLSSNRRTLEDSGIVTSYRVATNLENVENSGNLKNCENLRENSGKFALLWRKPGKLRESEKYVT